MVKHGSFNICNESLRCFLIVDVQLALFNLFNPTAPGKAKTVYNFALSECNRVKPNDHEIPEVQDQRSMTAMSLNLDDAFALPNWQICTHTGYPETSNATENNKRY